MIRRCNLLIASPALFDGDHPGGGAYRLLCRCRIVRSRPLFNSLRKPT